jgi:hypothetical protein
MHIFVKSEILCTSFFTLLLKYSQHRLVITGNWALGFDVREQERVARPLFERGSCCCASANYYRAGTWPGAPRSSYSHQKLGIWVFNVKCPNF